jgi:phosphate transport system substrate-binding protein
MKKVFYLSVFLLLQTLAAPAQNNTGSNSRTTIRYSGTRLTYPLVEAWIKEFTKLHPQVEFRQIPRGEDASGADIKILAYTLDKNNFKPDEQILIVSNYAQVPVTNSANPEVEKWKKTGVSDEQLQNLFFRKNTTAGAAGHNIVTVYTRDIPACATKSFAGHYGKETGEINGKPVSGDDRSLIEAVLKDTNGVTFNNLGFVYNLQTGKVKDGISVIPLDINGNGKLDENEQYYEDLQKLINAIEAGKIPQLSVDNVNFVFSKNPSPALSEFVDWVVTDGQKLNHQFGFLKTGTTDIVKGIAGKGNN